MQIILYVFSYDTVRNTHETLEMIIKKPSQDLTSVIEFYFKANDELQNLEKNQITLKNVIGQKYIFQIFCYMIYMTFTASLRTMSSFNIYPIISTLAE